MGSIHTQISLVDAVSDTIYNIADSMNLLIAGFEAAQIAGDRAFDPSSVNEMRAAIEQVYGSTDAIVTGCWLKSANILLKKGNILWI